MIIILILVVLIKLFCIDIYLITNNSMYPTLKHNESIIVKKFAVHKTQIYYGNIIVFLYNKKITLCKRIVALQHDIIYQKNNIIYIKISKENKKYFYISKLQYKYNNIIYIDKDINNTKKLLKIKSNNYFVIGDNQNSLDSKHFGSIHKKQIIGIMIFKYK